METVKNWTQKRAWFPDVSCNNSLKSVDDSTRSNVEQDVTAFALQLHARPQSSNTCPDTSASKWD